MCDVIIQDVQEVSDDVAIKEIDVLKSENPSISIAELAERTCFDFDQIEQIVEM